MSIPDPFEVEPVHITIHNTGRTPEEIVAKLRELYPPRLALLEQTAEKLGAAKARISTLEALTDQLVEALRDSCVWPPLPRYRNNIAAALRAYEADKEARS